MFGSATDEALRVEELVELALDWVEVRIAPDAVDEVVLKAFRLDLMRRLVREDLYTKISSAPL